MPSQSHPPRIEHAKKKLLFDIALSRGLSGVVSVSRYREIQIAARMAGVTKLVFYCGTDSKDDVLSFNAELTRQFKFKLGIAVDRVVDRLVAETFSVGHTGWQLKGG